MKALSAFVESASGNVFHTHLECKQESHTQSKYGESTVKQGASAKKDASAPA